MLIFSILLSLSSVQTKIANIITSKVNSSFNTSIFIEKVDLSSLRRVKLKNVLIKDHHQDTLIFVSSLNTSILSYKGVLDGSLNLGDIELKDGKLLMRTYIGEDTNSLTVFTEKFDNGEEKSDKPFRLSSSSIFFHNVDFTLIDQNKSKLPIVFYHNINGYFDDFKLEGPSITTKIHDLQTTENHDITVTKFDSDFSYSNTKMEFLNSFLQTESSDLKADIIFNYQEGDLSDFTSKVMIDADFKEANIALTDLKKFYKEFGKNDKIHLSTIMKGTLNDFVLNDLNLKSDRNSRFRGNIHVENAIDSGNIIIDSDIKELSTSKDHLVNLFPSLLGKKLPSSFEKFGYFTSSGKLNVTKSSIYTKLKIKSELGSSKIDLKLNNINNINNANYKGNIELTDFNLGKFAKDSLIGELSMTAKIEGVGFTIDKLNTQVIGHISKHQYKGYTYTNIDINGVFKNKHFNGELLIDDPNIQLIFKGLADLSGEKYKFDFNADVGFADFYDLNLFTRDKKSILKGEIEIKLEGSNLDDIEGEINFKNSVYVNQNDIYSFTDFNISSVKNDSIRQVKIESSDIINGSVIGDFKFRELPKLVKNSLGSLFVNYDKMDVSKGQFLDFHFKIYNKIIDVFFPEINLGPNTSIRGSINSDKDLFKLVVKSPNIKAFDILVDNVKLQIDNKNPLINTFLSVDKVESKFYNIANLNLVNVVLNDTLFIRTDFVGGKENKETYDFSFYQTVNKNNQMVFGIKKSKIVFKDNVWEINENNNHQNKIVFDQGFKTFAIDNISMASGNQHVDLAGIINGEKELNVDLKLENVNLYDITPAIDSVKIDGKVNGFVNFKKENGSIIPIADITVNYFSINDNFYGDLFVKASSDASIKNYVFESKLINGDLTSFNAKGFLVLNTENPTILASIKFDNFDISAFSPLGKDVLSDIRGYASGNAEISGILKNPDITGEILLRDAGIKLPYLNVNYDFLGESKVKLYKQTFEFTPITLQDNLMETKGLLKGSISHKGFSKWKLDLELTTNNLLVLNTKETEDALYYGTGLLAGKTTLKGFTDELVIDVDGTTNKGTEFFIPISYVSTINQNRLIHFEDPTKIEENKEKEDEIVFEELKGLSINFNLHVTKDAIAEIVIDKATGSLLRGSGDGDLMLNIDTNGKFDMNGVFVVDNGEYQFKNIVNKDFIVKKGGTIIWNGVPFEAALNIEAVNHTKANPAVLLDEINSSRKIDVDLITTITGSLDAAEFDFDIQIPNADSNVKSELDFKLSNKDDKLTQFFSLLTTGAFINLDNGTRFDGNAAITGTLAQKASQIMSNMLMSENDDFQVGVTYDIGTTNNVTDVDTDDQLGVEVSGRIFDKVIVNGKVGVPVGSNTNSNVIGEVEIVIPLNDAETFQAKVYNKQNEIQFSIAEGEGYTQGAGISYRFNFDNYKEFFEKIGWRKTEKEKLYTKEQRDSIKKENKRFKKLLKEENKKQE